MLVKRAAVWAAVTASVAVVGGCGGGSTSSPTPTGSPTTTSSSAVSTSDTPTASAASTTTGAGATTPPVSQTTVTAAAPVPVDIQKLNAAAWPAPVGLPLDSTYQWQFSGAAHEITSTADRNGGLYWLSACEDAPTVSANGWKGSQEVAFAPTKNFVPSGHEPGYAAPWATVGILLVFADAKSATAAATAMGKVNDGCAARLTGLHEAGGVVGKRVASTATGQSWSVTAASSNVDFSEAHSYVVQRGSLLMLLRVTRNVGFSQAPAYTGDADTAVLNDIADHLCAYAGACQ